MAFMLDYNDMPGNVIAIHLDPVDGQGLARRLTLQPGETFAIGRASRTQSTASHPVRTTPSVKNAFFDCPVISRTHAELEASVTRQSYVTITDLGSMHGTSVNGVPLVANEPFELKDGDIIKLGDNVSRGADVFSSMNLVFKYGSSFDASGGHSSYGVPDESDVSDDGYDSYREDDIDSIRDYDFDEDHLEEEQSPPTSVAAGDTPTKPIKLDADEPIFLDEPVFAEIPEEIIADSLAPPQILLGTNAVLPSIDLEAPEILNSRGQPLAPIISNAGIDTAPAILPMMHGALPLPVTVVQEISAESTASKMAIPNMLAPTATAAPAQPQITHVEAIVELKPQTTTVVKKTAGQKRKRADQDTSQSEDHAAILAKLEDHSRNRCALAKAAPRRHDPLPESSRHANHQASQTVDPWTSIDIDELLDGLDLMPAPQAKRARLNKRSQRSFFRETVKYTAGAAMGAVGTFAFLASPLGGRFADWLSTI